MNLQARKEVVGESDIYQIRSRGGCGVEYQGDCVKARELVLGVTKVGHWRSALANATRDSSICN